MKKIIFLRTAIVMAILVLASNKCANRPGGDVKSTNTVKVVDNKGTIKYFQSNNGITQITTADKTTTTWQLGGTLTEDTFIDATGKVFGLQGLDITALDASADGASTGYTLLVSDDATGKVKSSNNYFNSRWCCRKVLVNDESTTYTAYRSCWVANGEN
jgi:hypothetical protein